MHLFLANNNQVRFLKLQLFFQDFAYKYFLVLRLRFLDLDFLCHKDGFKLQQKSFHLSLLFLALLNYFLNQFKLLSKLLKSFQKSFLKCLKYLFCCLNMDDNVYQLFSFYRF